jgi:hypothetical protein
LAGLAALEASETARPTASTGVQRMGERRSAHMAGVGV